MATSTESVQSFIEDAGFNGPSEVRGGPLTSTLSPIVEFKARVKDEIFERDVILRFNPITHRTVGSTKDNDLYLIDKSVSQMHAILVLNGETLQIADACSPGGTFVNGERLARGERRSIRDGDVIQFGAAQTKISKASKGGNNASQAGRTHA
jgi:hypothetical protein